MGNEYASTEELSKAIKIAQLEELVDTLPDGLDSFVAQGGSNYSGGQKQRICIARALIKPAEIYVFDDSFSALDYKTDAALRAALHKHMSELYETLDETERRIHKELVVMKQKQKEIREQKKQLKLMIDTNEEEFPVEEIPFDCMISTEFEDIVEIKKFLPNYSSFGMMSMPASSSQTMYGFFIDPSEVHLFTQDVIWEKKDTAVYRRFLLKSEMNHAERNNILEIRERMYEKGWKTGEVIGQYLLTNTDENNIRTEYYHAWIEMKK